MQDHSRVVFYVMIILVVALAIVFLVMDGDIISPTVLQSASGHVLVIDAGHGGEDGGAVNGDGLYESTLNLEIAQKLECLCRFAGCDCIMTRDSEQIEYPDDLKKTSKRKVYDQKKRLELINNTPGAVLVSIHQNKYPSASPRGPQAFYKKDEDSAALAGLIQERMNSVLYPENRRGAKKIPDEIYLMRNANCTAVLTECGFISNPVEAKLLSDGAYQTKIALCLLSAYSVFIG